MAIGKRAAPATSNEAASAWVGDAAQYWKFVARADELLGARLADARQFGTFSDLALVGEIYTSLCTGADDAGGSVLLLGEAGSGKSHAVEACLAMLRKAKGASEGGLVVVRAHGGFYNTDAECVRHLASQVQGASKLGLEAPGKNASFEQCMAFLRDVIRLCLSQSSAAVVVLDKFENFCSKSRQTLLYNLFDVAQEASVRLSIIGMSDKMDVMENLEKRIRSRFSMRHLLAHRPKMPSELLAILSEKLRLPEDCGLGAAFIKRFKSDVDAALRARAMSWETQLEMGKTPPWFLWQCLPVARLLREEAPIVDLGAKRTKVALPLTSLPCVTGPTQVQRSLMDGLSEDEHVVLLSLHRLKEREKKRTLSAVLLDITRLHDERKLLARFSEDRYIGAFDKLLQLRLVAVAPPGAGDPPRRYQACESRAIGLYEVLVKELKARSSGGMDNPLRRLPEAIQQWAAHEG